MLWNASGCRRTDNGQRCRAVNRPIEAQSEGWRKTSAASRRAGTPRRVDLLPVLDRLIYLAGVPADWDGDGGKGPTGLAIATAAKIVTAVAQQLEGKAGERI